MFTCPHCTKPLNRSKALLSFGNCNIQCNHCNALLKPDRSINQRINIIGGMTLGVLAIAGYMIAALPGMLLACLAGYSAIVTVILTKSRFYIVE